MVYGYYTRTIRRQALAEAQCPNCGAAAKMELQVICKVNHLMFIPFYPNKKDVIQRCKVCDAAYVPFTDTQQEAARLVMAARRPWYYYIGLMLMVAFFGGIGHMIWQEKRENRRELLEQVDRLDENMMINYKLDGGRRTSMFVMAVRGDSIIVRENRLSTDKNVSEINDAGNFSSVPKLYMRDDIHKMVRSGSIMKIYDARIR